MKVEARDRGAGTVEKLIPEPLRAVLRRLLHFIWYVHPGVTLVVDASPNVILYTLATAAKPSMKRLHLRGIFQNGRRYQIHAEPGGNFSVMTTSKVMWHYRRRTSSSAILYGEFNAEEGVSTILYLSARIRPMYLLGFALIPLYFTIFMIYMPWSPLFLLVTLGGLWILSWITRRYNAMLEAHEMVYFIHKALEDLIADQTPLLAADHSAGVVYEAGFAEAWERFYEEHAAPNMNTSPEVEEIDPAAS